MTVWCSGTDSMASLSNNYILSSRVCDGGVMRQVEFYAVLVSYDGKDPDICGDVPLK